MEQTAERIRFDFLPGLPIVVEPKATLMSSDAGMIPIRQFDDQIGFADRFVASQPTLSRFENAIDIPSLWRLHDFFLDDFIASFEQPPSHIRLDIGALDGRGDQGGSLVVTALSSWSSFAASTSSTSTCLYSSPVPRPSPGAPGAHPATGGLAISDGPAE